MYSRERRRESTRAAKFSAYRSTVVPEAQSAQKVSTDDAFCQRCDDLLALLEKEVGVGSPSTFMPPARTALNNFMTYLANDDWIARNITASSLSEFKAKLLDMSKSRLPSGDPRWPFMRDLSDRLADFVNGILRKMHPVKSVGSLANQITAHQPSDQNAPSKTLPSGIILARGVQMRIMRHHVWNHHFF